MIAADIGQTPGLWARAGMAGAITGLDWRGVAVLLPEGVDRAPVLELLKNFETGMLAGAAEKAADDKGGKKGG